MSMFLIFSNYFHQNKENVIIPNLCIPPILKIKKGQYVSEI